MHFSTKGMLSFQVFAAALIAATAGIAAEPEVNLLLEGTFKPVIMHGRPSAAYGWYLVDRARINHSKKTKKYLSGEGCFSLDFKDGVMTVSLPDPLNPAYVKQRMEFGSRVSRP
ncbi:MAG: hypothetical protein PHV59_12840, partial [Victivallales bacterium]|nr:hypothetical protein [Victivallales bacterium]